MPVLQIPVRPMGPRVSQQWLPGVRPGACPQDIPWGIICHMGSEPETRQLLLRWHAGEPDALRDLLVQHLPFVRALVERRLGDRLRRFGEVDDYVQDAMVQALQYGPRFVLSDHEQFRALLARITENVLCDQAERLRAGKRDPARLQPFPEDSTLQLDPGVRSVTRPSAAAQRSQDRAMVALAIELLPIEDRIVVRRREWEGVSFAAIGDELGISEDAARMRFQRLLPRLARLLERLHRGELAEILAETGSPPDGVAT